VIHDEVVEDHAKSGAWILHHQQAVEPAAAKQSSVVEGGDETRS
jgi:hypothetical protein